MTQGYVRVRIGGTYYPEHRIVMEGHLGRSLRDGEVVHHRNGVKHDNRIANLEVMDAREHTYLHNGKLTESDVAEIRRRYHRGSYKNGAAALGREFGVSGTTVRYIVSGKKWGSTL